MTQIICDRCKKVVGEKNVSMWAAGFAIVRCSANLDDWQGVDLCSECRESFRRWMDGTETKQKEDDET